MHYIGLMSGTSVDGIDAVVVAFGRAKRLSVIAAERYEFPADVRTEIQSLTRPGANDMARMAELDIELGQLFGDAANAVRETAGLGRADIAAIGSHGQTLRHHPLGPRPYTIQIADPSVIAERTGITTVADFRARDIAAGGHGAPLVPAFHAWLFRDPHRHRVIANIGGIANITYLPAEAGQTVVGFDTGPGNTLLDHWSQIHLGRGFDEGGRWAAAGQVDRALLKRLLADAYFDEPPPKSTGCEHFNLAWLEQHLSQDGHPTPQAIQTTLAELTTQSIQRALERFVPLVEELYVCGGGSHNDYLMARLATLVAPIPLATTTRLGLHPDWVEAAAFAWLARQTLSGKPGNLPAVTGARRPVILGGVYKA